MMTGFTMFSVSWEHNPDTHPYRRHGLDCHLYISDILPRHETCLLVWRTNTIPHKHKNVTWLKIFLFITAICAVFLFFNQLVIVFDSHKWRLSRMTQLFLYQPRLLLFRPVSSAAGSAHILHSLFYHSCSNCLS